jgi:anti-sigma factor RsiW
VTCRELADFIADYLSEALPALIRNEFDRHLSLCANCRNYLAHYRTTVELGRHAFDDLDREVSADVPEDLVKAILESRKQ